MFTFGEALFFQFFIWFIFLCALYFVVKWAVKNAINQSMLFSDEERGSNHKREVAKAEERWNLKDEKDAGE
ncbi:DUF6019 family protein [Bacillus sp. 1P06AnD]|uniref:DUF6019 family protein n=1 Tax=Bacillus sp. 1P06AnD TaxID=3132208 RepID=UPI00399F8581